MVKITAANTPQTVIFEGDMLPEKAAYLKHLGRDILFEHRRDKTDTEAFVSTLIHEGQHPDLIEFGGESVLIGPEKDPQPGTVRHLLRKILPYSPWKATARVVLFHNAQGIKDEAETALLKTLEEPMPNHYFFLSVQTAEMLKETIRSRAVITRFVPALNEGNLPLDPWLRFYYLAHARDFLSDFPDAAANLTSVSREVFDELCYASADFSALEKMLFIAPRKFMEKESVSVQTRALRFAVLPVLAALRDRVTGGMTPPIAPVVLSRIPVERALKAAALIEAYLRNLDVRIFGNRPLNQHAVFYSFFFRFFTLWADGS